MNKYIYSGFWRRFFSSLINVLAVFIFKFSLLCIPFYNDLWIKLYHYFYDDIIMLYILVIIFLCICFPILSYFDIIPGERLLKIKVVTAKGEKLSIFRALIRETTKLIIYFVLVFCQIGLLRISGYFLVIYQKFIKDELFLFILIPQILAIIINSLCIIFSKEKTTLYDIICSTRVVRRNRIKS